MAIDAAIAELRAGGLDLLRPAPGSELRKSRGRKRKPGALEGQLPRDPALVPARRVCATFSTFTFCALENSTHHSSYITGSIRPPAMKLQRHALLESCHLVSSIKGATRRRSCASSARRFSRV